VGAAGGETSRPGRHSWNYSSVIEESDRTDAIGLMLAGVAIGWQVVDLEVPATSSPIYSLAASRKKIGRGDWTDDDFRFLTEALRGFTGVASAQLRGLSSLLRDDGALYLHPSMTLIRGLAEACGTAMWILEPWITPIGEDESVLAEEWEQLSAPILPRTQLVMLDAMSDRIRRRRAEGNEAGAVQDAAGLQAQKDRIRLAQGEGGSTLTGDRRQWTIAGQRMPSRTELAVMATEYSYGQQFRNSGMNPYPMLSGYAHASLDVVFAYDNADERVPISNVLVGREDEVQKISALGLQIYAAMLNFVIKAIGFPVEDFEEWDGRVDEFATRPAKSKDKKGQQAES